MCSLESYTYRTTHLSAVLGIGAGHMRICRAFFGRFVSKVRSLVRHWPKYTRKDQVEGRFQRLSDPEGWPSGAEGGGSGGGGSGGGGVGAVALRPWGVVKASPGSSTCQSGSGPVPVPFTPGVRVR